MYEEYYALFGNMNTMYEYRINYMLLVNKYNALAMKYNRLLDEMAALQTTAIAEISIPPQATPVQARDMSWNPLCPLGETHSDMDTEPCMSCVDKIYVNAKDVYGISISQPMEFMQENADLELVVMDASGNHATVDVYNHEVCVNQTTVDWSTNEISVMDTSGNQSTVDVYNHEISMMDTSGNHTTVDWSTNEISVMDPSGNQTTVDFSNHEISVLDTSGNQTTVDVYNHEISVMDPSGNHTTVDLSNISIMDLCGNQPDQGTRDLDFPMDLISAHFAQNNIINELAEAIQHHSSSDSSDMSSCWVSRDDYDDQSLVEDPNKIMLHLRDDIHHIHIPTATTLHHFHHKVIPQIHQEKKKKKFGSMHFS
jgi:hypothetical protein